MAQAINQSLQLAGVNRAIIKATFINRLDKYLDDICYALNIAKSQDEEAELILFKTFYSLSWIVPIIEEVVPNGKYTISDAFVAVYGENSDAVCMFNKFMQEYEQMIS